MKLVTLDAFPAGRTGVVVGDDVLDFALAASVVPLAGWVPTTIGPLLAGGAPGLEIIRRIIDQALSGPPERREALHASGALRPLATAQLLAPVPQPRLLLSHGRAYHSHRKEMRRSYDAANDEPPSAFIKNANSIVGPGAAIVLPPQCPSMVDLEVEFSLVFGADCHHVSPDEALDYVAGYTLINDVSARDWVENFRDTGNPDLNRMGKQLPTFTPLGPVVVTKDEIPDPHDVAVRSSINDTLMQDSHTSDLIYRIPDLIAYFSRWYRFRPGDVLTTGSPGGNGYGRNPKVFVKPGDVITVAADVVGALTNPVVAG